MHVAVDRDRRILAGAAISPGRRWTKILGRTPVLLALGISILMHCAALTAQQARPQPPAGDYLKILDDPARIERLKPYEVLEKLGLRAGDMVADIGSGSGLFSRPMARAVSPGGKVYAVDVDRELLEHVARTSREEGIDNLVAVLGHEDSPGLAPGTIDLAFICDTLHHIRNRESYLINLRRVLKPGGRVAIIDFTDGWPASHQSMKFGLEDLDRWAGQAGLLKDSEYGFIQGNFFRIYVRK